MAFKDPQQTATTDMKNIVKDVTVPDNFTDSPDYTGKTEWLFSDYNENYGYYTEIPQVNIIIDTFTTYTIGKGIKADPEDQFIIDGIIGSGKQTFNEILATMIRDMLLAGDSYAEIIRGDDGVTANIKVHHPGTIRSWYNKMGIIERYEKIDVNDPKKKVLWKFQPEEILHLSRNRIADQVHGSNIIEPLKWVIDAKNEAIKDWRTALHRNVVPIRIIEVDSDKTAKLDEVKREYANAKNDFEAMVVPKGTVTITKEEAGLENPLPWMNYLDNLFYEVSGVPRIVLGNAQELTEAGGKVSYVTFFQRIRTKQLYIEETIGQQLGLTIELEIPAEIRNELISDERKDGPMNFQENETTVGGGGQ